MKNTSIFVAKAISFGDALSLKSLAMAYMRSSVLLSIYSNSSAFDIESNFAIYTWSTPISRERTAFKRLSSIVLPTLMTSPVAFI